MTAPKFATPGCAGYRISSRQYSRLWRSICKSVSGALIMSYEPNYDCCKISNLRNFYDKAVQPGSVSRSLGLLNHGSTIWAPTKLSTHSIN
eukprot:6188067-Pleurochrysis_carterae.AAC.3